MPLQVPLGSGQSLRRLLPSPSHPSSSSSTTPLPKVVKRQIEKERRAIPAACSGCRKQKAKCSGERPACKRCENRGFLCEYNTQPGETPLQALKRSYHAIQGRGTAHEQIYELLRTLSDQQAEEIFQRIRQGTSVTAILDHINTGNVLLELAVTPESRLRYVLPYRPEMPAELLCDNVYLETRLLEATSLYNSSVSNAAGQPRYLPNHDNARVEAHFPNDQDLYLKPYHAAQVIDPSFSNARPSRWTTICSDNELMRSLLATFFRCEYQFTTAFQKDYFLHDMIEGREDFCSSLLVNIVLGYSCACYTPFLNRAEYWNPQTLGYRFLAEAKRLWEYEATNPKLTTIQAGILFNVYYNLCGLDEIGQGFRLQAIALAQRLDLFDVKDDSNNETMRNGKIFTAWALFSWEALVGFSFMTYPKIKNPPRNPLPDPVLAPHWYGEIYVRYPLSQRPVATDFGQSFRSKCQFRIIMHEFCLVAYSQENRDFGLSADEARTLYFKLRKWYENLSEPLLAQNIALPSHLQLHMYFHMLLLTIYEPLIGIKTSEAPNPGNIVADANKYLQTLIRLYYLRHGFEAMDLFIVIPLMLAGFKCTDTMSASKSASSLEFSRSTLMLVAKGLYYQRRNHYLAQALYQVIRGRMRPEEVALLRDMPEMDEPKTQEQKELMQAVRSHWPVSIVKKKEELQSHILKNLVQSFAHLNVHEDNVPNQPG